MLVLHVVCFFPNSFEHLNTYLFYISNYEYLELSFKSYHLKKNHLIFSRLSDPPNLDKQHRI